MHPAPELVMKERAPRGPPTAKAPEPGPGNMPPACDSTEEAVMVSHPEGDLSAAHMLFPTALRTYTVGAEEMEAQVCQRLVVMKPCPFSTDRRMEGSILK